MVSNNSFKYQIVANNSINQAKLGLIVSTRLCSKISPNINFLNPFWGLQRQNQSKKLTQLKDDTIQIHIFRQIWLFWSTSYIYMNCGGMDAEKSVVWQVKTLDNFVNWKLWSRPAGRRAQVGQLRDPLKQSWTFGNVRRWCSCQSWDYSLINKKLICKVAAGQGREAERQRGRRCENFDKVETKFHKRLLSALTSTQAGHLSI